MPHRVALLFLLYCAGVSRGSELSWRLDRDEPQRWAHNEHRWPVEKRLTSKLLSKYAQWGIVGRPVINSSDVMTVRLGLALIQILDLEENKQMLRTNCWLRFTWRDSLLSWENWTEPEFRAIKQIRVAPSQIWTPDIKLYNFADERTMEVREARIVVDRSGDVLWIPQALLKTTCQVTIMHFPFDTQLCCIRFGSWTYDERQLLLDWSMTDLRLNDTFSIQKLLPFVDFSDYVESNEWETDGEREMDVADPDDRILQIRSGVTYRHEPAHDWQGRPVQKKFRLLEYRIRMMRNPSFYLAILVVPCILLSMLTLVVFCLPPEAPAKMLLGMNIFVAFFILLLLLAELIPSAVETFPLIGRYYCVNMGIITLSTFLVTIIVNLHFNGDKSGPMPPLLRRIMIEGLGCLLLVRCRAPPPNDPVQRRDSSESLMSGAAAATMGAAAGAAAPVSMQTAALSSVAGPSGCSSGGRGNISIGGGGGVGGRCKNFRIAEMSVKPAMNHGGGGGGSVGGILGLRKAWSAVGDVSRRAPHIGLLLSCPPQVEEDLQEISRLVRMFLGKKKATDAANLVSMEWRTLARVLDRLFFVTYLILIATFILLFIPVRVQNVRSPPCGGSARSCGVGCKLGPM